MRIYILNLLLILCCIILMIATHPPACSNGETPLKMAIIAADAAASQFPVARPAVYFSDDDVEDVIEAPSSFSDDDLHD